VGVVNVAGLHYALAAMLAAAACYLVVLARELAGIVFAWALIEALSGRAMGARA
jgi:hypothetical protein